MRLLAIPVLVLLAFFACRPTPDPTIALPAPWGEMVLPIEEGAVTSAATAGVHVRYPETPPAAVLDDWHEALVAQGWEAEPSVQVTGLTTTRFHRDGERVELVVSGDDGATEVLLSR